MIISGRAILKEGKGDVSSLVVRFEHKVIVSEPQRDESNYEPYDSSLWDSLRITYYI